MAVDVNQQQKKPPVLPYAQPGKNLQLTQPTTNPWTPTGTPFNFQGGQNPPQINQQNIQGVQSQYTPDQMNQMVLQAGQNRALQGFQSPTGQMLSQQTQQLLQNPQMGVNPQQQVQQNLETYDQQRAQAMEAARQKLAPVMHTGEARGDFMDLAIQGAQQRAQFESEQTAAAQQQARQNLLDALAAGRETAETERKRFATDIGALVDIRGAAEGQEERSFEQAERATDRGMDVAKTNLAATLQVGSQIMDQQGQMALAELQGKIDQGLLLTGQDFQATQAELDRQLEQAIAEGRWENAISLEQLRGELQIQMQESEQAFQRSERTAEQTWQTTERLAAQEYERANMYLDQELREATAQNNFRREKELVDLKAKLDLKARTQMMEHDEKMALLESELAEARANGDVDRQKQILTFQHAQEMDVLAEEQGFVAAQAYLDRQHDIARQTNDYVYQKALLEAEQEWKAKEAAEDRLLEQQRINLQARGVDMAEVEQQYDMLQEEVAAGRADPDAALNYLNGVLAENGLEQVDPADSNAAYEALQEDYQLQEYQFALTNPEYAEYDAEGNFLGLKDEGSNAFRDYLNETYYGEDGMPTPGGGDVSNLEFGQRGTLTDGKKPLSDGQISTRLRNAHEETNPNHERYLELLAEAPRPTVDDVFENHGYPTPAAKDGIGPVALPSAVGSDEMKLMKITHRSASKQGFNRYNVLDYTTGQTKIVEEDELKKMLGG